VLGITNLTQVRVVVVVVVVCFPSAALFPPE
jgi:hypothetical protein